MAREAFPGWYRHHACRRLPGSARRCPRRHRAADRAPGPRRRWYVWPRPGLRACDHRHLRSGHHRGRSRAGGHRLGGEEPVDLLRRRVSERGGRPSLGYLSGPRGVLRGCHHRVPGLSAEVPGPDRSRSPRRGRRVAGSAVVIPLGGAATLRRAGSQHLGATECPAARSASPATPTTPAAKLAGVRGPLTPRSSLGGDRQRYDRGRQIWHGCSPPRLAAPTTRTSSG